MSRGSADSGTMSRGSAYSSVFSTPALTARVLEYLELRRSLKSSAVCHAFYDAVPLISCARITRSVLRNPHLFVRRLKGLQRLDVQCRGDDCARFLAIACSSVRKWRDVRIYPTESDLVTDQLVASLWSLARAVQTGLLPELEDFYFEGIYEKMTESPEPARQKVQNAALRLLSALPINAAVRIGLVWGLPVDSIRPFAGATFDPNLESEWMDPVAASFAFRSDVPCQSFVRELVQRGMRLNESGPLRTYSALGVCMGQRNFGMARVYLELGADPNFGHPSPLELLCKSDGYPTEEWTQMLKVLLKAGADPFASFDGKTAMDSLISCLVEIDSELFEMHKNRFEEAVEDSFPIGDDREFELSDWDQPKAAKAALLEMQSLLARAMCDGHRQLRQKLAAATKKARS